MRPAGPEVTAAILDWLRAMWPGWEISRGADLRWRARHETWPADIRLGAPGPGALNEQIEALDDVADARADGDPRCLGCVEELTTSPQGWRAASTGLLTCRGGLTPGRPHSITLPRGR